MRDLEQHLQILKISSAGAAVQLAVFTSITSWGAVAAYYTLAWLDRYVIGATDPTMAEDARRRLLATTFDGSADVYSIGTGIFDPYKASANNIEAGNVPITIRGLSVPNMLSFWYPSRYYLDGGLHECENMKAGCP